MAEICKEISIIGPIGCTICFQFIMINSLYMSQAFICASSGGIVHVYIKIGIFCTFYVSWLLAGLKWNKYSKHVDAINKNKLKVNSVSCWSYYTDILQ
jgi:hypothetical protein